VMIAPPTATAISPPPLSARAAALVEQSTGQTLYGRAATARLAIASTTKLMTALLTLEHVKRLGTIFTQGSYRPAPAESQIGLARHLPMHFRFFVPISHLPRAVLLTGSHRRLVTNRNDLVAHYPWVNGVKTGHTLSAGYVMVGSGTRGRMTLISAVLGTRSESARDGDTLALLRSGFAKLHLLTP